MSAKKYILVSFAVAIFLGIFTSIQIQASKKNDDKANEKPTKKVTASEITLSEFSPKSPYCSFAVGAQRSEIVPEVGGIVQELFKNEGDMVRSGEIIAIINDSTIDAQVSGSSQISADLQKTYDDTKKLYAQKVDEAKAALKKIKANYNDGDAVREDVKLAEEAVDSAKRARNLQLSSARVQISSAKSQQSIANSYAQKQTIRAPSSGTITRRHTTIGSFVAAGTPIYSLSAPGIAEIELNIPKNIIENLSTNQEINLAKEDSAIATGFVYAKNPFSNSANQSGIVRLRAKNPLENSISIGDYICAKFPLEDSRKALTVSENSILHEFGDSFVFTVQNGIAIKKNITTGATAEGKTEIISGLQDKEIIITEGIFEIHNNDRITF